MNLLEEILSSRTRAAIFGLLFGVEAAPLYIRELQRRSGLSIGSVRQEALKLVRIGLVLRRTSGNRTYYEPNTKHPLYEDIRRIVLKTTGLADVLRQALGHQRIRCAFVFGSVAAATEKPESDVDLMVIGEIGLREISQRLSGVSARIGREINPHALTPAEFAKRRSATDHFILSVLQSPRVWIVGNEDELEAMGR